MSKTKQRLTKLVQQSRSDSKHYEVASIYAESKQDGLTSLIQKKSLFADRRYEGVGDVPSKHLAELAAIDNDGGFKAFLADV